MAKTARRQLGGRQLLFGEYLRSWTNLNVHLTSMQVSMFSLCFYTRNYFERIIMQLMNSAFVGYEELSKSRSMLFTLTFGLGG